MLTGTFTCTYMPRAQESSYKHLHTPTHSHTVPIHTHMHMHMCTHTPHARVHTHRVNNRMCSPESTLVSLVYYSGSVLCVAAPIQVRTKVHVLRSLSCQTSSALSSSLPFLTEPHSPVDSAGSCVSECRVVTTFNGCLTTTLLLAPSSPHYMYCIVSHCSLNYTAWAYNM